MKRKDRYTGPGLGQPYAVRELQSTLKIARLELTTNTMNMTHVSDSFVHCVMHYFFNKLKKINMYLEFTVCGLGTQKSHFLTSNLQVSTIILTHQCQLKTLQEEHKYMQIFSTSLK